MPEKKNNKKETTDRYPFSRESMENVAKGLAKTLDESVDKEHDEDTPDDEYCENMCVNCWMQASYDDSWSLRVITNAFGDEYYGCRLQVEHGLVNAWLDTEKGVIIADNDRYRAECPITEKARKAADRWVLDFIEYFGGFSKLKRKDSK